MSGVSNQQTIVREGTMNLASQHNSPLRITDVANDFLEHYPTVYDSSQWGSWRSFALDNDGHNHATHGAIKDKKRQEFETNNSIDKNGWNAVSSFLWDTLMQKEQQQRPTQDLIEQGVATSYNKERKRKIAEKSALIHGLEQRLLLKERQVTRLEARIESLTESLNTSYTSFDKQSYYMKQEGEKHEADLAMLVKQLQRITDERQQQELTISRVHTELEHEKDQVVILKSKLCECQTNLLDTQNRLRRLEICCFLSHCCRRIFTAFRIIDGNQYLKELVRMSLKPNTAPPLTLRVTSERSTVEYDLTTLLNVQILPLHTAPHNRVLDERNEKIQKLIAHTPSRVYLYLKGISQPLCFEFPTETETTQFGMLMEVLLTDMQTSRESKAYRYGNSRQLHDTKKPSLIPVDELGEFFFGFSQPPLLNDTINTLQHEARNYSHSKAVTFSNRHASFSQASLPDLIDAEVDQIEPPSPFIRGNDYIKIVGRNKHFHKNSVLAPNFCANAVISNNNDISSHFGYPRNQQFVKCGPLRYKDDGSSNILKESTSSKSSLRNRKDPTLSIKKKTVSAGIHSDLPLYRQDFYYNNYEPFDIMNFHPDGYDDSHYVFPTKEHTTDRLSCRRAVNSLLEKLKTQQRFEGQSFNEKQSSDESALQLQRVRQRKIHCTSSFNDQPAQTRKNSSPASNKGTFRSPSPSVVSKISGTSNPTSLTADDRNSPDQTYRQSLKPTPLLPLNKQKDGRLGVFIRREKQLQLCDTLTNEKRHSSSVDYNQCINGSSNGSKDIIEHSPLVTLEMELLDTRQSWDLGSSTSSMTTQSENKNNDLGARPSPGSNHRFNGYNDNLITKQAATTFSQEQVYNDRETLEKDSMFNIKETERRQDTNNEESNWVTNVWDLGQAPHEDPSGENSNFGVQDEFAKKETTILNSSTQRKYVYYNQDKKTKPCSSRFTGSNSKDSTTLSVHPIDNAAIPSSALLTRTLSFENSNIGAMKNEDTSSEHLMLQNTDWSPLMRLCLSSDDEHDKDDSYSSSSLHQKTDQFHKKDAK